MPAPPNTAVVEPAGESADPTFNEAVMAVLVSSSGSPLSWYVPGPPGWPESWAVITVPAGMEVPAEPFEEDVEDDVEDEPRVGLAMTSPTESGVSLLMEVTVRIEPLVSALPLLMVPMKGMPKTRETGTWVPFTRAVSCRSIWVPGAIVVPGAADSISPGASLMVLAEDTAETLRISPAAPSPSLMPPVKLAVRLSSVPMFPVKVICWPPIRWTYPTCLLRFGANLAQPLRLFPCTPPAKPRLATKIWPSADSTSECGITTVSWPLAALPVLPPPVPLVPFIVVMKLDASCHSPSTNLYCRT